MANIVLSGASFSEPLLPANTAVALECGDSAYSYDYWYATKIEAINVTELDANKAIDTLHKRIRHYAKLVPMAAISVGAIWLTVFQSLSLPSQTIFSPNFDSDSAEVRTVGIKPQGCTAKTVAVSQLVDEDTLTFRIVINETIWAKLDSTNRVFVYGQLIFGQPYDTDQFDNESCYGSRRLLNAFLLSTDFLSYTREEWLDIIFEYDDFCLN